MAVHNATNLRLEVQDTPTGLVNLIPNSNGDDGPWGWITPTASHFINRIADPSVPGQFAMQFAGGLPPGNFYAEPVPITPGQYIGAFLTVRAIAGTASYTWGIDYLDVNGVLIAGGAAQRALAVGVNRIHPGNWTGGTSPAPSGARFARLRVLYVSGNATVTFREATMVAQGTTTGLSALGYIAPPGFTNILSSVGEIAVEREELNASTLSATFDSTALDPAVNTLLRPGKAVRLTVSVGASWFPIFTGRIDGVPTVYRLTNPDSTRRARITLNAVDAAAVLANAKRPEGVGTIAELPYVLEGAGTPWVANGSQSQISTSTVNVVSRNTDASALDQIAITRDSVRGYAWINGSGFLHAWDAASLPNTIDQTLTEPDYGDDLDVSFDLESVINEVSVTLLRTNLATGETVEVPFGPYRDQNSVRIWGSRSATFVVHGIAESAVPAYAAAVLASNATPQVRINSATIAVRTAADIGNTVVGQRRIVDLYDLHRLTNTAKGIDQQSRVTRISHKISPDSWTIGLGYRATGSVASPQTTPPVQNAPVSDSGNVSASAPFTGSMKFVPSGGIVFAVGSVARASGFSASFVNTGIVVPLALRPPAGVTFPANPFANSTINYQFVVQTDGNVQVRQSAANTVGMVLNGFWGLT